MFKQREFPISKKICEKMVRVEIADGRQYIGIFVACDKSGSIIVNDALELVDLCPDRAFQHDLISPYVMTYPVPKEDSKSNYPSTSKLQPKYMGSLNVNKKDLKRILIDKKAEQFYQDMIASFKQNNFIYEQSSRSIATEQKKQEFDDIVSKKNKALA